MALQRLPPAIISLVHHIELNKAGWWDKALDQLLIATIWVAGKEQSTDEIIEQFRRTLHVVVEKSKVQERLDRLMSKSILISMPEDRLKLSESFLETYHEEIAKTEALELSVEESFVSILKKHCPSLDGKQTWTKFNESFLLPFVRDTGANTYKLLAEGNLRITPGRFVRFVADYPKDIHEPFAEVVKEFFDPKKQNLRSYILRNLNAFFFIEASSLTKDTLDNLIKLSGNPPTFNIFVDTNFLFSILGLVPSATDAISVVELISQLKTQLNVRLYALPTTIDEAKSTLIHTKVRLSGLRIVPNLAKAASQMNLGSLEAKYFEESPKRGLLSPEDYFDLYIDDMISMMRAKGVELYNEDFDGYKTRQDVVDDILFQLESEKKKYKHRAKNYEKLEHDMILWHAARDRRPIRIDSPIDAKFWVVTIDYRMLGFDKFKKRVFKKRGQGNVVPICVYPTTLIQMLQFWVPRTPEFEEAMLSSMRLPFSFPEFDPSAEKVTLDILKSLSQYEAVGDLKTETVSSLLMNQALRDKISKTQGDAKAKLIRDALLDQHKKTTEQLAAMTDKLRLKEDELSAETEKKRGVEETLATKLADVEALQTKVADLQAVSAAEKETLSGRILQLENAEQARLESARLRHSRRGLTLAWAVVPIFILIVMMTGFGFGVSTATSWKLWKILLLLNSGAVLAWAAILDQIGSRNETIKDWTVFKKFKRLRAWIFTLLGALVIGLAANFIYGWI